MNLLDIPISLRSHFEQTPDVLNGKLRVAGTRVSVEQILDLLEAGVTPAEIIQSFPSLTEQDVAAVGQLAVHFLNNAVRLMPRPLQAFGLLIHKLF